MLLAGAMIVRLHPGQFVFYSGGACDAFLILLAGSVRVQLSSSRGRAVTLCRVAPGDYCVVTTSCLLKDEVYPADGVAETAADFIAVPKVDFLKALNCSPAFRGYIFDGYSSNLATIIGKFEQLAFVPIDARLSSALLDLHDKGERSITHLQLSVELGTAREVVSRRLKHFESSGWIRLARGRITVSNRDELMSLSD